MRKVTVPVDMASEQKSILGIISKRQLIYFIIGGSIIYSYTPTVFNFVPNILISVIICLMAATPTAAVVFFLAFYKVEKYQLSLDKYFLIKAQYRTQLGCWRKGR
ncbi:PrgI family protein [Sutcliffiella horikoshii]|uniref:PrgI family protein n=1 Tax=Sutcliffiella horikoshii TaxID=79883 RepID=UPI001CBD7E73|nr:PrgI family protein [Sutcliffiella horikoshii]MCM3619702.1 PrgI family protein [Sutcliffiella horikoshii]UAL49773.1 PrgI family protein [Sutcliffiella horikoshii]